MRKLFTLFVILCLAYGTNAQIRKGAIFLGGNLAFTSQNTTETPATPTTSNPPVKSETKGIYILPAIGWAIKENLVLGVELTYSKYSNDNTNNSYVNSTRTSGGGFFLRRYFPVGKKFYAFGQADLAYSDIHNEQVTNSTFNNTAKTNGWRVGAALAPGMAYQVSKAFFLETGIGNLFSIAYGKDKSTTQVPNGTTTSTTDSKVFGISTALSGNVIANIGFRFIIPHK